MLHVTGGYAGNGYSDDILEAQGDQWRKVGTFTNGRNHQGVSVINFDDFVKYCNN